MSAAPRRNGSLRRRLLLAAAAWIALALVVVGVLLVALFRDHVEEELATRAAAPLDALAAAVTVAPAASEGGVATLRLSAEPTDDAFRRPYGGAYWWIADAAQTPLRSRSWWDTQPPASLAAAFAGLHSARIGRFTAQGPQQQPLVVWARRVELAAWDRPLVVAVAFDATQLQGMTRDFARTVAIALGVLALALFAASWLQVRLGLSPLTRLQRALAQLRDGQARHLDGRFPAEVQPLVADLNALLDDNDRLVRQAREQTGNLAHALKTPLAVLNNAAAAWPGDEGEQMRRQLGQVQRQVDLQLARARATSAGRVPGRAVDQRGDASAVVDALLRTLQQLHAARAIVVQRTGDSTPPAVALDAESLHELLGNLLDNAFQHARHRVTVSLAVDGAVLGVTIDDDGPGIPPERREEALQRGRRLDETAPGTGLGLAIADELVRLAGGALTLDRAPAGGLRVALSLPLAVNAGAA